MKVLDDNVFAIIKSRSSSRGASISSNSLSQPFPE